MTAWIYDRMVDSEHPAKTVARVVAFILALLPLVMAVVILR